METNFILLFHLGSLTLVSIFRIHVGDLVRLSVKNVKSSTADIA